MDASSEYSFPIFISSTDYNLKDFRAELSRFLKELGYRPVLSSAEGFPDNSPKLEPWESCIPVLGNCFVVILVIDGRYGTALPWPNFPTVYGSQKVSPTHGEYIFAHKMNRRMLVFIRREMMIYYQNYRQAVKTFNKDEKKIAKCLKSVLPPHVDFEALKFIHQVKTQKPIPWIKEFEDITDVKKEVQKKMLNELAEIFLIKDKHLHTIIEAFNKVLSTASPDEQKRMLTEINVAKPFIDAFELMQEKNKELGVAQKELTELKVENVKEKQQLEERIKKLQSEIGRDKSSTNIFFDKIYFEDGIIKFNKPDLFENDSYTQLSGSTLPNNVFIDYKIKNWDFIYKKCDGCGKPDTLLRFKTPADKYNVYDFNECPNCRRYFCIDCWNKPKTIKADIKAGSKVPVCPECEKDEGEAVVE